MSQSAVLAIQTTGYGQPGFSNTDPYSFDEGLAYTAAYAFETGFQTITPPDGAVGVKITNLDGTLTIKGETGDTGFVVDETANAAFPLMIPITTNLTLTASAGATASITWFLGG